MSQPTPAGPDRRKVIIGVLVGGAVLVGGLWWYRAHRAASAGEIVDPATGSAGTDGGYTNPNPTSGGGGTVNTLPEDAITSNDQWMRVVLEDLVQLGWDQQYVATVLSAYLAGQEVTLDQAATVRTAWGLRGHPPQDVQLHLVQTSPTPAPVPTPPPSTPSGGGTANGKRYVPTARYTSTNPPWNSTLSGIASHEHTTVDRLMDLNKGNPTVRSRNLIIYPGSVRVA